MGLVRPNEVSEVSPAVHSNAPSEDQAAATDENKIYDQVLAQIDPALVVRMPRPELASRTEQLVARVADEHRLLLNQEEQRALAARMVDDMIGLGPLERLLKDEIVSDILVNGAHQVYVERRGKLVMSDIDFRNEMHVLHIARRIASAVGRRVDESSPMLDARLADGSRVNVVIPPLTPKGTCISIRKFSRSFIGFANLIELHSLSPAMARALEIAARCRINMLVSGGTGSGKTTLLNALSSLISPEERVITIEDTAELQLQQPHVVTMEGRPANVEGKGQVTQRDLVRNALRMRPDRIIVGEVRGAEAFDMLQAMNTGHNGSMSTIHANSGRDALARIENMVMMANLNLPSSAIRGQIASALDLIVQVERMRDGTRRVTEMTEVAGMEESVITLSTLFKFKYEGENPDGTLRGSFSSSGVRPRFLPRLEYYGLERAFMDTLGSAN